MSAPVLEVCALAFAYPDGQQALFDVSFAVTAGEAVGIIGSNGAGKSTLLLHLNGVHQAAQGHVVVNGQVVSRGNVQQVRRSVGMVFQDPDDQLFMPTVADDVAFGPSNMGLSTSEVASRVAQALDAVGAAHLAQRAPYRLSGGEKRAVALAGVLAMRPDVLVLDEPSAALDPRARRRLIHWLRELPHTRLIASHDLDLVQDVCSRVLVLREGRLVADGTPAAIFADAALLQRCHLEPPLRQQAKP